MGVPVLTGPIGWAAAADPAPADIVSPGIAGFLIVFVLALATVVLVRSMVGHLRKVRYGPGPQEGPDAAVEPPAAPPDAAVDPPAAPPDAAVESPAAPPDAAGRPASLPPR